MCGPGGTCRAPAAGNEVTGFPLGGFYPPPVQFPNTGVLLNPIPRPLDAFESFKCNATGARWGALLARVGAHNNIRKLTWRWIENEWRRSRVFAPSRLPAVCSSVRFLGVAPNPGWNVLHKNASCSSSRAVRGDTPLFRWTNHPRDLVVRNGHPTT